MSEDGTITTAPDEARIRLLAAGSITKGRRTLVTGLPLEHIRPNPEQPRRYFDEQSLAELAQSIRERGVLQPVIVKRETDDQYLLLAGERRYRASKMAGLTAIPKDIPEAAAVDGAGFFRTLFQITIPMMLPIINVAVLFGAIFTFTDMTVIYILTRGGPYDMTQVIPSEAFFTGVLGSDLAEGATISIFLVPLLVVAAYFMLRTAHRAEVT